MEPGDQFYFEGTKYKMGASGVAYNLDSSHSAGIPGEAVVQPVDAGPKPFQSVKIQQVLYGSKVYDKDQNLVGRITGDEPTSDAGNTATITKLDGSYGEIPWNTVVLVTAPENTNFSETLSDWDGTFAGETPAPDEGLPLLTAAEADSILAKQQNIGAINVTPVAAGKLNVGQVVYSSAGEPVGVVTAKPLLKDIVTIHGTKAGGKTDFSGDYSTSAPFYVSTKTPSAPVVPAPAPLSAGPESEAAAQAKLDAAPPLGAAGVEGGEPKVGDVIYTASGAPAYVVLGNPDIDTWTLLDKQGNVDVHTQKSWYVAKPAAPAPAPSGMGVAPGQEHPNVVNMGNLNVGDKFKIYVDEQPGEHNGWFDKATGVITGNKAGTVHYKFLTLPSYGGTDLDHALTVSRTAPATKRQVHLIEPDAPAPSAPSSAPVGAEPPLTAPPGSKSKKAYLMDVGTVVYSTTPGSWSARSRTVRCRRKREDLRAASGRDGQAVQGIDNLQAGFRRCGVDPLLLPPRGRSHERQTEDPGTSRSATSSTRRTPGGESPRSLASSSSRTASTGSSS